LAADLPADEWEESGLTRMPRRWALTTTSGDVAAMAGCERWGQALAHLGVASAPASRRRGFARSVARHATSAAVREGLVTQWRWRVGNEPSERLAQTLGFVRTGRQGAVLVDPEIASGAASGARA
jgi:RimJ/RimL family protein N-acetyltransferase